MTSASGSPCSLKLQFWRGLWPFFRLHEKNILFNQQHSAAFFCCSQCAWEARPLGWARNWSFVALPLFAIRDNFSCELMRPECLSECLDLDSNVFSENSMTSGYTGLLKSVTLFYFTCMHCIFNSVAFKGICNLHYHMSRTCSQHVSQPLTHRLIVSQYPFLNSFSLKFSLPPIKIQLAQ